MRLYLSLIKSYQINIFFNYLIILKLFSIAIELILYLCISQNNRIICQTLYKKDELRTTIVENVIPSSIVCWEVNTMEICVF